MLVSSHIINSRSYNPRKRYSHGAEFTELGPKMAGMGGQILQGMRIGYTNIKYSFSVGEDALVNK